MRHALALTLAAAMLGGCASHTIENPSGIWINQNAIDAAAKGGNLRQALLANGPNLEWNVNTQANQASVSNGFELSEGTMSSLGKDQWKVDFYGNSQDTLSLDDDELVQASSDNTPQQVFLKAATPASAEAPPGTTFEQSLYSAYLGGDWKISDGPGAGAVVHFGSSGQVDGLPGIDRYALCLAGDCAAMSGEFDSMWLEKGQQGNAFIFKRNGKQLEIIQAVNQAAADEMPDLRPGARRWLLVR